MELVLLGAAAATFLTSFYLEWWPGITIGVLATIAVLVLVIT